MGLEEEMQQLDYGKLKSRKEFKGLEREMLFTRKHIELKDRNPYLREAECLALQMEMTLMPVEEGDLFAGRLDRMMVGIDPERGDLTEAGFFCQSGLLEEELKNPGRSTSLKEDIIFLLEYWKTNSTYSKCRAAFPDHIKRDIPDDEYYKGLQISFPMYGLGGPALDFEKLIRLGIPGLENMVIAGMDSADTGQEYTPGFPEAVLYSLLGLKKVMIRYAGETITKAERSPDQQAAANYRRIAESMVSLTEREPRSFFEGLQLVWIYSLSSLVKNYGRMDLYLGDLLAADLEKGNLDYNEALEILVGFYRMIVARGDNFNNRIIVGGRGRKNEKNADIFALLALDAQEIVNEAIPQLSLRWYEGMDIRIWDRTFEVLASGSTMPIIYNDDINIPGIQKAMGLNQEEAEDYAFYGCGEFLTDHRAVASPDAALNVLKALDVSIRKGVDSFSGEKQGIAYKSLPEYDSFEELKYSFARQVDYQLSMLADAQDIIYRITGQDACFPLLSLLYDDCIERGRPLLSGGVRYRSGTVECFGNNSASDALYAIKKLVFDEKKITAKRMLECLDKDFIDCDDERIMMVNVPKFGNDHQEADEMSVWLNDMVCRSAMRQREYTGLDSFLVVLINNGDSVLHGKTTGASADGRKKGKPLSNGNQPGAGNDTEGVTSLLNSMSKLDAGLHAGTTQNIKFSRKFFREKPESVKALVRAFFKSGGTQLMITTTDRGELEEAIKDPSSYRHIFVRVGGYSERFVDLPEEIQREVIMRTLY